MDGTRGENQHLVNNDDVIIKAVRQSAGLLFYFSHPGRGMSFIIRWMSPARLAK